MGAAAKHEKIEIINIKNRLLNALAIENKDTRIKYLEQCLTLCDNQKISSSHRMKLKRVINDCIIDTRQFKF